MNEAAGAQERKMQLRRQLRAALDESVATPPGGGDAAAYRIALFARRVLYGKRRVALYLAGPREVDLTVLTRLLQRDGAEIFLPHTVGRGPGAQLRFFAAAGHTQPRAAGGHADCTPVDHLDAVVLPGLAFDMHGGRLGQGWGCYDRALAGYRGLTVAVAHREQIGVGLPCEGHDRRVDVVVTPCGVWRTQRG